MFSKILKFQHLQAHIVSNSKMMLPRAFSFTQTKDNLHEQALNEDLQNVIDQLQDLENSKTQQLQEKLLSQMKALRTDFANQIENLLTTETDNDELNSLKSAQSHNQQKDILNELYTIRQDLAKQYEWTAYAQNQMMRKDERIKHIRRNFKRLFDQNNHLKKRNAQLQLELQELLKK